MKLTEDPHRRLNPLTNEWVLVSPHRAGRPWQGQVEKVATEREPEYDPTCYLCPGNPRVGGVLNPRYTGTFVFDNDFAALKPGVRDDRLDLENRGLLVAEGEPGLCRVICFSPRHDLTLATMSPKEIESVIRTWTAQFQELAHMPEINHVQIFENRGSTMGASNPHPHCQIWATHSVPDIPAKELAGQANHIEVHNTCLLCDYLQLEGRSRSVWFARTTASSPWCPSGRSGRSRFWCAAAVIWERFLNLMTRSSSLAQFLQQVTSTYDRVFDVPFPYSMGFHQSPTDGSPHHEWHFHAHFYPPLLRSATIRKFMVGFEMLGMPQRDITPESAAAHLKSLSTKP